MHKGGLTLARPEAESEKPPQEHLLNVFLYVLLNVFLLQLGSLGEHSAFLCVGRSVWEGGGI